MSTPPYSPAATNRNGLVLAGFIVALVGLLLSFFGGGILLGIVAIVLLIIGVRRGGRSGMSTAGFVIAGVAILLSIVILGLGIAAGIASQQ